MRRWTTIGMAAVLAGFVYVPAIGQTTNGNLPRDNVSGGALNQRSPGNIVNAGRLGLTTITDEKPEEKEKKLTTQIIEGIINGFLQAIQNFFSTLNLVNDLSGLLGSPAPANPSTPSG